MPQFQTADGVNLYYEESGSGHPVIALPGLTRNTRDFDHVAPHLPVHLIRMDYRGRGQSDWADPATYTVPREAADVLALMDHLGLKKAALLGTSRGGLIAMMMAATAKDRLTGIALNDIGPDIAESGLDVIRDYIGRNPSQKTYAEAAAFREKTWTHFRNVPMERWLAEVRNQYKETPEGLIIRYDPKLRDAVLGSGANLSPDLWPLFEKMADLPLALIHGVNSDLLTTATADEMQRRRPEMIRANVPDRGHVPFLDEPEALDALRQWIGQLS